MRKKALLLALTLILALSVAQVAWAGPGGWGGKGGGFNPGANCINPINQAQSLGLTTEQAAKVQELQKSMYDQTRDLRAKLMDAMFALRQLRWQASPDQAAIDAKLKEVNELRSQLSQAAQENRQKVESILTPEQRSKLPAYGALGGRHGGMGMGGGPRFNAPTQNK